MKLPIIASYTHPLKHGVILHSLTGCGGTRDVHKSMARALIEHGFAKPCGVCFANGAWEKTLSKPPLVVVRKPGRGWHYWNRSGRVTYKCVNCGEKRREDITKANLGLPKEGCIKVKGRRK